MKAEAERALKWKEEGKRGGTRIGLTRARQIIRGDEISYDVVLRMYSYFERHLVDKEAEGFYPDEDGYPSAGRVAWGLWGGDAAHDWSKNIREQQMKKEEQERDFSNLDKGNKMEILRRRSELQKRNGEEYEKEYEKKEEEYINDIWSFVISTPEIDRYGTIIVPSGIDYSSYMNNPIVLAQHNSDSWPVGKCLGFYLNGENLEASIQIECITEEGRTLNKLIDAGFVKAVSVGIIPIESEEQTIDGQKVTVYTKSELVEFSVVSVPANRNALIKRTFKNIITDSIQKFKKENRMLTPETEQKINEELLPAILEAVASELVNLGFSPEESQAAAEAFAMKGGEHLLATLAGKPLPTEDQISEPPVAEPPVEVVSENPEAQNTEAISANYSADEIRIGKKIGASTAAQISEGMEMIQNGYKKIKQAVSLDSVRDFEVENVRKETKVERVYSLNLPVQKTTDELLELI